MGNSGGVYTLVLVRLGRDASFLDNAGKIRPSFDQGWLQGCFCAGDVHIDDQLGELWKLGVFKASYSHKSARRMTKLEILVLSAQERSGGGSRGGGGL